MNTKRQIPDYIKEIFEKYPDTPYFEEHIFDDDGNYVRIYWMNNKKEEKKK